MQEAIQSHNQVDENARQVIKRTRHVWWTPSLGQGWGQIKRVSGWVVMTLLRVRTVGRIPVPGLAATSFFGLLRVWERGQPHP